MSTSDCHLGVAVMGRFMFACLLCGIFTPNYGGQTAFDTGIPNDSNLADVDKIMVIQIKKSKPGDISAFVGEDVSLKCQVILKMDSPQAPPEVHLVWTQTSLTDSTKLTRHFDPLETLDSPSSLPGAPVSNFTSTVNLTYTGWERLNDSHTSRNLTLVLYNVTQERDEGNYTCKTLRVLKSNKAASIAVRVKVQLYALWPFLGFLVEVLVMCAAIFIYEKRRTKAAEARQIVETTSTTVDDGVTITQTHRTVITPATTTRT